MENIALFREGVAIRKHEVEQAKISAAKDNAELSKLKNEEKVLKGIVQQLKGIFFIIHCLQIGFSIHTRGGNLNIIFMIGPKHFCSFFKNERVVLNMITKIY